MRHGKASLWRVGVQSAPCHDDDDVPFEMVLAWPSVQRRCRRSHRKGSESKPSGEMC
jgi:hypothetical protein